MRIRLAVPDRHVDTDILDAALEATTRAAQAQLEAGEAPDIREAIASGVKWRPEPYTDGEHFDLPSVAAARGWFDCDDGAPWLAATLRASGEDPGAVAFSKRSGPKTWHCMVRTSDGRVLDPSRWAGMKTRADVSGRQICRPMAASGHGGLAIVRDGRSWRARADLPWPESASHVASYARDPDINRAVSRAVIGAALCGSALDSEAAERAFALADELVQPAVGSWLTDALSAAAPIAASFVPGGSVALEAARGLLGRSGPSAAPGGYQTVQTPSGAQMSIPPGPASPVMPIIVRF